MFAIRCAPICASALLLAACSDPKSGIRIEIVSPPRVEVGTPFRINAIVRNGSGTRARLDSIDIGNSYLDSVQLLGSEPAWIDTMQVPIDETRSHEFQAMIEPGASLTVTFTALMPSAGRASGDFDICVNSVMNCFFEHIATEAE